MLWEQQFVPLAPSTWEHYHGGLHTIVNKNYGVGIDIALVEQRELCDSCTLGKQTRVSFMPKSPHHAKKLLEVIHKVHATRGLNRLKTAAGLCVKA